MLVGYQKRKGEEHYPGEDHHMLGIVKETSSSNNSTGGTICKIDERFMS